jgi:hypothetical protein
MDKAEIFNEIRSGMKDWAEDWDEEIQNPPIDETGRPILEEVPTENPAGPTLADFIATFHEEDQDGFEDFVYDLSEEEQAAIKATLLTAIWQY